MSAFFISSPNTGMAPFRVYGNWATTYVGSGHILDDPLCYLGQGWPYVIQITVPSGNFEAGRTRFDAKGS